MAKKYSIILALVFVLVFAGVASALSPVTIYVNGQEVKTDVPAYINQGRTMVPIRFVAEALKAQVDWDAKTRSVSISTSDKPSLTLLKLNGEQTTWPYWYEDGKLFMEYKNTLDLLREYNPMYSLYYNKSSHELGINNWIRNIYYTVKGDYIVISLNQIRDFGYINYDFDPYTGNLTLNR